MISLLGLYLIPGLGSSTIRALVKRFGYPSMVFKARHGDLVRVE